MTTTTASVGAPIAIRDRRFFLGMAIAIALVVFVGFAPTYYLRPLFQSTPLAPVFHAHGLVFTAWIALLIVQSGLVSARRTDLHRRIGPIGGLVGLLMLGVGYAAAMHAARNGFSVPGLPPPLVFLVVPLGDLVLFAGFLGAALYQRRNPAAHKRLMILATLATVTAAIARLPGVLPLGPLAFFALTDLFVIAMAIHDRKTRGRLHPATLWGGLALVVSQPLRLAVSGTSWWLAFAGWLTR